VAGPLAHLHVLDLSRVMAGPWASQLLADLGADVIKVERPGVGDDTRSWGPPFLDGDGDAGYFLSVNRGKRSITVNLQDPDGQRLLLALAARADILLENYKVGTLARFGLDYASVQQVNPAIIYASISGFGQTGPRAHQAAYDFMIQAMGGLMSVTGEADSRPGGGPQKVGVPIVDLMTGMYTTVGVLAALARRERTGEGDYIDVALLDVQAAFLANQNMNYLMRGTAPRRTGNRHPNIQPQDVFRCRDGSIALACGNDGQFEALCAVIARPDLARDARFATNAARVAHVDELHALLTSIFETRDARDWTDALDAAGVPCSVINTIAQVLTDPQIAHRQLVRQLPRPSRGDVPQVVAPLKFAHAPLEYHRAPPALGQDTDAVLADLGLGADEIAGLRTRGVI